LFLLAANKQNKSYSTIFVPKWIGRVRSEFGRVQSEFGYNFFFGRGAWKT